jgi:hypothetical protein
MGLTETPEPDHIGAWRRVVRAAGRRIGFGRARPDQSNPWRDSFLQRCRNVIRFSLWICLAANAAMVGVFSILFTYQFLRHLWFWCLRAWFSSQW